MNPLRELALTYTINGVFFPQPREPSHMSTNTTVNFEHAWEQTSLSAYLKAKFADRELSRTL